MSEEGKEILDPSSSDEAPDPGGFQGKNGTAPELTGAWGALLAQVARAPDVDPTPFVKLASGKKGLVGQRLGHFLILERLGEGGMGVVYKAQDESLERLVALKLVRPKYLVDSAQHQRLIREARSAAAVNHPNIAAIYEVGEADGMAFIAMEYVDGKPLRSSIEQHPLSEADAVRFAIEIARGLARAHAAGIVHRDLKPDNLLVDRDAHVKILDFGLAKELQQIAGEPNAGPRQAEGKSARLSKESQVLGTPSYMSPEQADGREVDARSDIYSFGVLLHELLTGHLPEPSATCSTDPRGRALQSIAAGKRAARIAPAPASPALNELIQRCLHVDRTQRFADGAELLEGLLKVAREPRHGLRWRALALIALAAGSAFAWFLWQRSAQTRSQVSPSFLGERRLTANPPENMVRDAAIAPDGHSLAYVDQSGLSLRRIDPPTTEHLSLPDDLVPNAVSWYPDSEALFVAAWTRTKSASSLLKVNTRTGEAKRLSDGPVWRMPRMAPDGESVAWIDSKGIHWKRLSDDLSRLLVASAEDDLVFNLTWSPTGKRLAYVRTRAANKGPRSSVETVDLSGGPPRAVVEDQHLIQESGETALGWAPDGRLVYGLADWPPREPGTALWTVAVDPTSGEVKGQPARIASWTSSVEGTLTISKTGRLAFQRYIGQLDVYIAELIERGTRMNTPRRLTMTELDERPTDWSPDGKRVIFMSNQNGSQHAFAQEVTSTTAQMLTSGTAWHTWPRFAQNGVLLFWQLPPDVELSRAELMRMDLTERRPIRVLTAGEPVFQQRNGRPPPRNVQFRCPSQGGPCVLSELERNELRFSAFDPVAGWTRELIRMELDQTPRFVEWDLAPDGKRIVLPRIDGSIRILDLSNKQLSDRMIESRCYFQFASWNANGTGVFLAGRCPGPKMYKLLMAELSGAVHLLHESSNEWIGNPVASPDGSTLAFALKPQKVDVWLLEQF